MNLFLKWVRRYTWCWRDAAWSSSSAFISHKTIVMSL